MPATDLMKALPPAGTFAGGDSSFCLGWEDVGCDALPFGLVFAHTVSEFSSSFVAIDEEAEEKLAGILNPSRFYVVTDGRATVSTVNPEKLVEEAWVCFSVIQRAHVICHVSNAQLFFFFLLVFFILSFLTRVYSPNLVIRAKNF